MSGTIDLNWLPSYRGSAEYTHLLNLSIVNVSNANTYRFENFQVTSTLSAGTHSATLTGHFYHSIYGDRYNYNE